MTGDAFKTCSLEGMMRPYSAARAQLGGRSQARLLPFQAALKLALMAWAGSILMSSCVAPAVEVTSTAAVSVPDTEASGAGSPTTTVRVSTTTTSSTSEEEVEPPSVEFLVELTPPVPSDQLEEWSPVLSIGYGAAPDLLGIDRFGPEYAAVDPSGVWWVLDTAKERLARFDTAGSFLGDISVDIYAQRPILLDDGTFLAFSFDQLLRVLDEKADVLTLATSFSPLTDDGSVVYGRAQDGVFPTLTFANGRPQTGEASWLRTRGGKQFRITNDADAGVVRVEWAGDQRGGIDLKTVRPGDPSAPLPVGFELATGENDTVYLLLIGSPVHDPETIGQLLARFVAISPDGTLATTAVSQAVFDEAGPASASHLVVQPNTSNVYLVTVSGGGLQVLRLSG